MRRCSIVLLALATLAAVPPQGSKALLGEAKIKPSSGEVTATRSTTGIAVAIVPGKDGYPGIGFAPPSGSWDLSAYGHIEARIVNTGTKPLTVALRVDNAGPWQDNPWNTESVTLGPGERGTVSALFGYAYGRKPGYKLDPAKVLNVLFFTTKADGPESFRIESLTAGGPPHEKPAASPDDVRTKPVGGVVFEPASAAPGSVDLLTEGGAISDTKGAVEFTVVGAVGRLRPALGRWDVREATQLRVTLRNAGETPATPRVRLESNGGDSPWVSLGRPLAPGAVAEVVVPFARAIDLGKTETVGGITSDAVKAVAFATEGTGRLEVRAIHAEAPVAVLPSWLGKRPPVAGDWTKTLDQEFDGTRLDAAVWKATGENYYDKQTHWSPGDVIVKDGIARLRYEKRTGFQNDDPKRNSTPYAAGYLDTYGLWAQRYGYFEARMKLPSAPGLWPAFWMMPDRGAASGEQWKRQSTADGGMEFDIMEGLTRWGPHRYNVAMHYDGYEKDHKSLGSDKVYVEADKDGFVTCGLLWTPGLAVYYCNGREVLRWESPRVSNVPSILMFTLPMGGWDNDALDDARLPADFAIDYVRVWQRKDLIDRAK